MKDLEDGFELDRFVKAQEGAVDTALAEIRSGRKRSHWMWYVFPQFIGLGRSTMSQRYAIRSVAEAQAYLAHPVLGPRLLECFEATLGVEGLAAQDIFGSPDDLKLRSCATLFAQVTAPGSVFAQVLEKYFDGERDSRSMAAMASAEEQGTSL